ncbi:MAG TPA: hypothetical protein VJ576_02745 [Rhodocyclaceae bacterium]|nr:hypothetical protein [Rhodocyclaceae bacterium]
MEPVVTTALALAQFAPSILRFFGVGEKPVAVAEKVVDIAKAVTGQATGPEALEAMRQSAGMAHEFQMAVLKADTDLEQAYLADRGDARARDIEVRKLTGGSNLRADVMVAAAAVGLVCCLAVLVFFRKEIPGEAVGIISTIAGIFGACLRDAFQFEFGSSRGSRDKDALIAGINK